jgi:hypothetical protein
MPTSRNTAATIQTTELVVRPGASASWLASITTSAGAAQSLAQLTAAWFTVKSTLAETDAEAPLQVTLAGGGIAVVSAAAGTLTISLTPAQTAGLEYGAAKYLWDLLLKFADGSVSPPDGMSGEIVIERSVTLSS